MIQQFMNYLDEDYLRRPDPEAHEQEGVPAISAGPNAFLYVKDAKEAAQCCRRGGTLSRPCREVIAQRQHWVGACAFGKRPKPVVLVAGTTLRAEPIRAGSFRPTVRTSRSWWRESRT
jgi:hypothetical protein